MSNFVHDLMKQLCVCTIILAGGIWAQSQEFRALISGQVFDPTRAVVPKAMVMAVREDGNQVYTAETNASGEYLVPYVLPGKYTVTVERQGFKKAVRKDVILDVAQKLNLNFTLEVGAANQEISITADAATVNTGDASGGAVMDLAKVQNLPLNGRQVWMLLQLTPGARFTQTQFGASGFSGTRGWDVNNSYTFNGVAGANQFSLNGATITQQAGGGRGTFELAPNVDAIQEFKIMTNTYDASYGRVGGATMNVTMKSGSNGFHGTAFDYWRNSVFDANVYGNNLLGKNANGDEIAPRGLHNQHQWGGTFGGPIRKNKTFFFGSFEGWREVVPFPVIGQSTPAPDVRLRADGSVDFSQFVAVQRLNGIFDPSTCASNAANCTRTQFPGNVIPANRISATGRSILALYPLPNGPGEFQNFNAPNLRGRYDYNQPIVRVDHEINEKTRIYGMWAWQKGHEFRNTSGFTGPAQIGNIFTERDNSTAILDTTHSFSATLLGDLRISWNRFHSDFPDGALSAGQAKLNPQDLGLTMPQVPTTSNSFAPNIQVSGYPDIIGNTDSVSMHEVYTLSPSVTESWRKHTFHYGAEYWLIHDANPSVGRPNGRFTFTGAFTTKTPNRTNNDGFALADMLLGVPSSGSVDFNTTTYESYPYWGFFFQDDYKIKPNLTLNLGLRWDDEGSPVDRHKVLNAGFCLTCVNPITNQITFPALPNGATMPNPLLGGLLFENQGHDPYNNYFDHWQPRLGVAWGITPKTVLRGGWAISYPAGVELGAITGFSQQTPYLASLDGGITPNNSFFNGSPFPNGIIQPLGSSQGLLTGIGNGLSFDQPTRRIAKVQQYSLGVQRELPGQILLDVSYVGSYTSDIRVGRELNTPTLDQVAQAQANNAFLDQLVNNPFFGVLPKNTGLGAAAEIPVWRLMIPFPEFNGNTFSFTDVGGFADYNSLQVKVEKKLHGGGALARGLTFLTAFTYSRSMSATSYLDNGNNASGGNTNIQDAKPAYQVDTTDRPFDLAFSGVWGLPIGKDGLIGNKAGGAVGALINNWNWDWVLTADSGTPVSALPNFIFNCPNSLRPAHQTFSEWIFNENPSCYQTVPRWQPRTALQRVSWLRNPYAPQLSMALGKQFVIKEGINLQFRAEAFNLTNTPIFGGPSLVGAQQAVQFKPNVPAGTPGSASGFGTIGATQQNFPRQLQMSLKILF